MPAFANRLNTLVNNPDSFADTAGFKFGLDNALGATQRSNSRMRGSGNALAALAKTGAGYAMQERGNEIDRLGRLEGQAQQYELGQGNLALGRDRLGLDTELGRGQLGLSRDRLGLDTELGRGGLENTRRANDQQFGLGMFRADNDLTLGTRAADSTDQRNLFDFTLGGERIATDRARNQNDFNLANSQNNLNWFNANTNRGTARSGDYYRGMEEDRLRMPFNPPRKIV